ncbi:MAG: DUF2249 domain-containing protein [Acidimicrobiales bacterium]
MTITDKDAFEAMLEHHAHLEDQVARRVATVRAAVDHKAPHEAALAELVAYVASDVLPHAIAEEQTIYKAAAATRELAPAISKMVGEHRELASLLEALAKSETGSEAAKTAGRIGSLFSSHVAEENEIVLPALRADENTHLGGLLSEMHRLTEEPEPQQPEQPQPLVGKAGDNDRAELEETLVGLLLEAAKVIAGGQDADQACRLVAHGWAALRTPRPDLAVKVTAALHGLVRSVTSEPVELTDGPPVTAHHDHGGGEVLDVRSLAPAKRHHDIFARYDLLEEEGAFVLVNDHDPRPLYYQFEAEHAGDFSWDYLESGPRVWRVRIGRPAGAPK